MSHQLRDAKRVVLCDDHEIVREAIKARMASSHVLEIVGEAGNGRDVVDVVKELEPDVLIIDVELPKRDGIEATKEVLKVRPRTKVIIFTAHAQPDLLALALRAGASGYVLKSAPAEDIARAVKAVTGGGTFLGGDFAGGKPSEVEKLLDLSPARAPDPRAARRGAAGQRDRRTALRSARPRSTPTSATRSPSSRSTPAPRPSPSPCASATSAPAAAVK